MEDIEKQFMVGLTHDMRDIERNVTDGQNSKLSGLGNDKTRQIVDQLKEDQRLTGGDNPLVNPPQSADDFAPLEITNDMLKEIADFDGEILPEMTSNVPASIPTTPNGNADTVVNDPNQMALNFDMVRAEDVMDELKVMKTAFRALHKELNIIKSLVEVLINNK